MPARTALLITIGDVIETGPPTTRRSSATSSASNGGQKQLIRTVSSLSNGRPGSKRNLHRSPSLTQSHHSDEEESEVSSYSTSEPVSEAEEDEGLAIGVSRTSRQRKKTATAAPASSSGGMKKVATRGQPTNGVPNGRKARHGSTHLDVSDFVDDEDVEEEFEGLEDQPLSPRTRSTSLRKENNGSTGRPSGEFDDEVSFSDPHHLSNTEGEEEDEDVFDSKSEPGTSRGHSNGNHSKEVMNGAKTIGNGPRKAAENGKSENRPKRKSAAERFLEDNSEYYGIQVLPNKLRKKIQPTSFFETSFLDFLNGRQRRSRDSWNFVDEEAGDADDSANDSSSGSASGTTEDENSESKRAGRRRKTGKGSMASGRKQRHRSECWETSNGGTSSSKPRRGRVSSSNGCSKVNLGPRDDSPIVPGKKLRVDLERLKVGKGVKVASEDEGEEGDEEEEDSEAEEVTTRPSRKSTRQSKANSSKDKSRGQDSPSPRRKKRTELDKLLDAGSSSFHFETAAQEKARESTEKATTSNGLGPIHVDVSESNSSEDAKETLKRKRGDVVAPAEEESEEEEEEETEEEESEAEEDEPPTKRGRSSRNGRVGRPPSSASAKKKGAKSKDGRRKKRRLLVTKQDLLDGPAFVGSKEDATKKRSDLLSRRRGSKGPELADYLPLDRFEALDSKLETVSPTEVKVNEMSFSFERTPFNEGWFQTYNRQDQCDEILYFPDTTCFPLPYEMPVTTFYPRKEGSTKKGIKRASREASGTATPDAESTFSSTRKGRREAAELEEQTSKSLRKLAASNNEASNKRKGSKASSTDSENAILALKKSEIPRSNILARLVSCSSSSERKSPRCHASTKALLHGGLSPEDGEEGDEEEVDVESTPVLRNRTTDPLLLDECSNDSTFSIASTASAMAKTNTNPRSKFISESQEEFNQLAGDLDSFLMAQDPELNALGVKDEAVEDDRPSSLTQKAKKKLRRSSGKSHHRSSKKSSVDPMDHTVACNVDPLLLDCLEDELPSVTLDDEVPGSSPLDLVSNFETCTSISFGSVRWKKRLQSLSSSTDSPYVTPAFGRKKSDKVKSFRQSNQLPPPPPPMRIKTVRAEVSSDEESEEEVLPRKVRGKQKVTSVAKKKLDKAKSLVKKKNILLLKREKARKAGATSSNSDLPRLPRSKIKKIIIPKKSTLRKRQLAEIKAAKKKGGRGRHPAANRDLNQNNRGKRKAAAATEAAEEASEAEEEPATTAAPTSTRRKAMAAAASSKSTPSPASKKRELRASRPGPACSKVTRSSGRKR